MKTKAVKTIGIVSLSSGILGETFITHEVNIGLRRLKEMGINVRMLPHALSGIEYIRDHPRKRAEDLLKAFLPDICELDTTMFPYTEKYFRELISTGTIRKITPSDVWYEERTDFSPSAIGTHLKKHKKTLVEDIRVPTLPISVTSISVMPYLDASSPSSSRPMSM